jgi:RibD C-terminal domain
MTGGGAFADKMNSMPKFVVSAELEKPEWNNSTVLSGDVVQQVSDLKQQTGGDILINGSATLVQTLMEHDLIDEYRLMVFPIVLGGGKRLFGNAMPLASPACAGREGESNFVLDRFERSLPRWRGRRSMADGVTNGSGERRRGPSPPRMSASEPRRCGGAAPSPGAGSGRCSRSGSAPGSPGALARPPRTDRLG